MSDRSAKMDSFISTNQQKVLSFLAKCSDQEYHEREIARKVGISYGSANTVLNELFSDGVLTRRRVGKMLFYSFSSTDPIFRSFKIYVSIAILRPLIFQLRRLASEVVLYGSCARGEDTARSDVDLFIVSEKKVEAVRIIESYRFPEGFRHIRIEPVILSLVETLKSEKNNKEFMSLVREGIVLWDVLKHEAGVQGLSEEREDFPISPRKSTRR